MDGVNTIPDFHHGKCQELIAARAPPRSTIVYCTVYLSYYLHGGDRFLWHIT
jgi:hypothetical protein